VGRITYRHGGYRKLAQTDETGQQGGADFQGVPLLGDTTRSYGGPVIGEAAFRPAAPPPPTPRRTTLCVARRWSAIEDATEQALDVVDPSGRRITATRVVTVDHSSSVDFRSAL